MSYRDLRCEIADGAAVVTPDRPNDRNAFSGPMATSLAAAYRECDARDDVRAVVLTGAGNAFCVGADLSVGGGKVAERGEGAFTAAPGRVPAVGRAEARDRRHQWPRGRHRAHARDAVRRAARRDGGEARV